MNEKDTQPVDSRQSPVETNQVRPRRARKSAIVVIILLLACLGAGFGGSYLYSQLNKDTTQLTSSYDGNVATTQEEEDIASIASKVSPSVVSIVTKSQARTLYSGATEQEGAGTGIIISKDGYILTNNHVIDGATEVSIVSADGTTYENVKIIGRDPLNDVAFLKVNNVSNLPAAQLGDSKSVRIGQKVVAIGNALGQYQNTVTSGIISGTGRSVTASTDGTAAGETESLTDLIQTDAAINSGNSGGPLVNMAGQVIGINTAIASDANSVGFVIPISSTKGVIESVLESGKVSRAYLGVRYASITPQLAKEYSLSVKQGAYIYSEGAGESVAPGGPAADAGVKEKDIITKVNDIDIGAKGSVATLVGEYKVGDTVELTILRGGKSMNIKVTLGAYNQPS